jgi:hypothetical protein
MSAKEHIGGKKRDPGDQEADASAAVVKETQPESDAGSDAVTKIPRR